MRRAWLFAALLASPASAATRGGPKVPEAGLPALPVAADLPAVSAGATLPAAVESPAGALALPPTPAAPDAAAPAPPAAPAAAPSPAAADATPAARAEAPARVSPGPSAGPASGGHRIPDSAIEETAAFKALQKAVRAGSAGPLPDEASTHRFLLVPGFSWDAMPRYFGPNLRRLKGLGLDARFVPTDPLGAPEANAETVRRAVLASDKPVVLIGHSKGGIDSLEALLRHPSLAERVSALVTIQTPHAGTAVADFFLQHPWLYHAAMAYTRVLNPLKSLLVSPFFRGGTVKKLSRAHRGPTAHETPAVGPGVRLFSIASRVKEDTAVKLLLWMTAGTVKTMIGLDNDGIVAPEQAVLAGSRYAILDHVGHVDTVSEPANWRHKVMGVRGHDPTFAADMTEAVVRWVFGG